MYWLVNVLPFNNSLRPRKLKLINEGAVLLKCKLISKQQNTIILHPGAIIRNTIFHIHGSNNFIEIGENASVNGAEFWIENNNNSITVGASTNLCGKIHLACTEGKSIRIGRDCLFSSEIVFRTGDSHSIVDMEGKRINLPEDIVIGDHVWMGYRVIISKGVKIPDNTVVGTGAIVTKEFDEENTILAGVPARVVKSGIDWSLDRL